MLKKPFSVTTETQSGKHHCLMPCSDNVLGEEYYMFHFVCQVFVVQGLHHHHPAGHDSS